MTVKKDVNMTNQRQSYAVQELLKTLKNFSAYSWIVELLDLVFSIKPFSPISFIITNIK